MPNSFAVRIVVAGLAWSAGCRAAPPSGGMLDSMSAATPTTDGAAPADARAAQVAAASSRGASVPAGRPGASAGSAAQSAHAAAAGASGVQAMQARAAAPAAGGGGAGSLPMSVAGTAAARSAGMIMENAGVYSFELGRRRLDVDAAHGARVTRFGLDEHNLLTGPEIDALNYGSTFWPSPQQRWGWPPVPELDSEPYEPLPAAGAVTFESKPGARAKIRVTKRVSAIAADGGVSITYTLANTDDASVAWAPWEITRVAAGGLSFFPSGPGGPVSSQLPVVEQAGITWYQHDPGAIGDEGQKFSADGAEGWLAHVAGRLLFVKRFTDVPPAMQAPAPEAEIALYAAKQYVEIEPQGPYAQLMPAEERSWMVRWYVTELPEDVSAELGSSALVELVRKLVAQPAT